MVIRPDRIRSNNILNQARMGAGTGPVGDEWAVRAARDIQRDRNAPVGESAIAGVHDMAHCMHRPFETW